MRIAINAMLLGGHKSGVELWIRHAVRAVSQADDRNQYVIYMRDDAEPLEFRAGWAVDVVRQPRRSRLGRIVWEQFVLPRRLSEDRIDVLHAPGYVMPLRTITPTVLTVHDVIALKFPHLASRANALHYRFVLPRSLRKAAVIIASSDTTKRDILDCVDVPEPKVRVVQPGIDPIYFRQPTEEQMARVKAQYDLPERFVLFVGNLEPKKNLPLLFRAMARLKQAGGPHAALVVVGGKTWRRRSALAGRDALIAGRDVRFLGHVPREHMPALYALAAVFAFPSLYEGFGFPPLEAMACGAPVVASDAPALSETLAGAAVQVPAEDAAALAEAIAAVLSDSAQHRELAAAGRARAAQFTWQAAATGILAAYEQAATQG